jgi:glycosyltransferase involved in cell wall biosynthesis
MSEPILMDMDEPEALRIGVDARLIGEPVTGIGRYTVELCSRLVETRHRWFLYTSRPPLRPGWERENLTLRAARFRSRAGRMLWAQTLLPWWARNDGLDLFWGATHRLPPWLPRRVARVVTIHDLVWRHAGETMRPTSRWLERTLMPRAVRAADRVLADSHSTAAALAAEFPDAADKVRVVHLAASPLAPPAPRESLSELGIVGDFILFVGTLEPRKNLPRLVEAYASLPSAARARARLVIAGGLGWGREDLAGTIARLGLRDRVVLAGYVDDGTLSTLYANALFLAMPSLYEGFGLPLLEAMSLGTPVLTSACSSLPEVAGESGLLVNPLEVQSIAQGLAALLLDDPLRQGLAAKSRSAAAGFSWDKTARETLAVFDEAIAARRAKLGRRAR